MEPQNSVIRCFLDISNDFNVPDIENFQRNNSGAVLTQLQISQLSVQQLFQLQFLNELVKEQAASETEYFRCDSLIVDPQKEQEKLVQVGSSQQRSSFANR